VRENKTLVELKFQENHIEERGATVLFESGAFDRKTGNTTLREFLVDVNIPAEIFDELLRASAGGGKKKGKKGKK